MNPSAEDYAVAKATKSKNPRTKPVEPTEVVVKYDLFDLPTAFHKAGLAGLVMLIESLKARRKLKDTDAKCELTATTAEIVFSLPLLNTLMDDLYDADHKEVAVKSKWQQATVVRPPTAAEKEAGTPYVYRVVQPKGKFLRDSYPDEDGLWLKLWRDMLWNIPRGRPTTREPYNQRAEGICCKEGPNAWVNLLKVEKARSASEFYIEEISSSLLPGAQATNAECVPFEGRAEQNLLLHFWPLSVLLFVPQQVESDGTTDFVGFTLAVPDVTNLQQFVTDFPFLLTQLNAGLPSDKTARGYRPAKAVIDIAAEGAIAFLEHLGALVNLQAESSELRYSLGSVEYLHLVKQGNNVKPMASGRVSPNRDLLVGYRSIVAPKLNVEPLNLNPVFRRGLLLALVEGDLTRDRWHRPFGRVLESFNVDLFIRHPRRAESEEKGMPHFANDAAARFRHEAKLFSGSLERSKTMPEAERPRTPLSVIINRVVRSYLQIRTKEKTGVDPEKYKNSEGDIDYKSIPGEFNEAKQKLAESLFFEFRSRKDQAFVDHFAATFFSVTQRFAEPDRLELADVLVNFERRDDLKTLTLLSLSANS
jgi:CRISPR-associated protein Cmx8